MEVLMFQWMWAPFSFNSPLNSYNNSPNILWTLLVFTLWAEEATPAQSYWACSKCTSIKGISSAPLGLDAKEEGPIVEAPAQESLEHQAVRAGDAEILSAAPEPGDSPREHRVTQCNAH